MPDIYQWNDIKRAAENCPSRGEQAHCWHRSSYTYTSNPSQHDETCCFCGRQDRIIDPPSSFSVTFKPGDHGPHARITAWNLNVG